MTEGGNRFSKTPAAEKSGKPLISIITVVYNAGETIIPTLLSIFNQTYQQIEFILIDGASTDRTLELALNYSGKIDYWRSEKDSGIYDAMNKGLETATGEYVFFLNAGDQLHHPTVIDEIFSGEIIGNLYYGSVELIDQSGKSLGKRRHLPPEKLTWKSFRMGMLVSHQAFIPERRITSAYRTDLKISADIDWCIACMKNADVIVNTHQVISKYLVGGMSRQNTLLSWKERYAVMKKFYGPVSTLFFHILIALKFTGYYLKSRRLD